jgi:hypothetical protein
MTRAARLAAAAALRVRGNLENSPASDPRFVPSTMRLDPGTNPHTDARFPRTPAGANDAAARRAEALPLVDAYVPPIRPAIGQMAPLPATGITDEIEVRTVQAIWPILPDLSVTDAEVQIYTTQRHWKALDVYFDDANVLPASGVFTFRVYAISAQGVPTIVATGRLGNGLYLGTSPLVVPMWVAAARAEADRFIVTMQLSGFAETSIGQVSTVTVVASNRADAAPPWLGAIRFLSTIGTSLLVSLPDAELLMVQAVIDPLVATPRYLHVHQTTDNPGPFMAPAFCFALPPVSQGGGGTWFFPPGLRSWGEKGIPGHNAWCLMGSTTAFFTTATADVALQGVFR